MAGCQVTHKPATNKDRFHALLLAEDSSKPTSCGSGHAMLQEVHMAYKAVTRTACL